MISQKYLFSVLAMIFLLLSGNSHAQIEGFGSITVGYNKNPLYNYLHEGDQLKESYLNLKYNKDFDYSALSFSYTGGLMLFNRFNERNYLEQLFGTNYTFQLVSEEEETEGSAVETDLAKVNELTFGLSAGSRIDKAVHSEFDNYVFNASAGYKNKSGFPFEINNVFSYRNYKELSELSNFTDMLSFQTVLGDIKELSYGFKASAGIKYYSSTVYDTSKYETVVTNNGTNGNGNGNGHGNGRGNGNGSGSGSGSTVTVGKSFLLQPQSNGIHQFTVGVFAGKQWSSTTLNMDLLYRFNTRDNVRYLAQYVNTSFLSEDIYNDFFAYQGPEGNIKLFTPLPLELKFSATGIIEHKKFNAPALTLNGDFVSSNRIDIRSTLELSLGKYIDIGSGMGLDVALNYSILRNQSNDEYNDFSLSYASVSIGFGF